MPLVNFLGDQISFPDFMTEDEISDVLGALFASTQAVGEFTTSLATGAVAEVAGGVAGLVTTRLTKDPLAGEAVLEGVSSRLTYQPRTRAGQVAMQSIAQDVARLGEAVGAENISGYWKDRVVPALQERAGPVAGSVLAAVGLGLLAAVSELSPGGRTRRVAGQRGMIKGLDTDTDWYHGTDEKFDAFSLEAIAHKDAAGRPAGGRNADAGFWFDTNKEIAKTYGDQVGAFYLPKDMRKVDWEIEMRESLRPDADYLSPDTSIDVDALSFDELEEWANPDGTALWDWMGDVIQEAKDAGESGVIFSNVVDANARFSGKVFPSNQAVVFNPNQIHRKAGIPD
jgi:hypothetical protein